LKKLGAERELRTTNIFRNLITVLGHAGMSTAEKHAKWVFCQFVKKYIAEKRMQK
jgi:hypothetical protein